MSPEQDGPQFIGAASSPDHMAAFLLAPGRPDFEPVRLPYVTGDDAGRVGVLVGDVCRVVDKHPFLREEGVVMVGRVLVDSQAEEGAQGKASGERPMEFFNGGFILDPTRNELTLDGTLTGLTPKEFEMLTYLVEHEGVVMSKEQMALDIWDYYNDKTSPKMINVHLKRLRAKLGRRYRRAVVTRRSVGLIFDSSVNLDKPEEA